MEHQHTKVQVRQVDHLLLVLLELVKQANEQTSPSQEHDDVLLKAQVLHGGRIDVCNTKQNTKLVLEILCKTLISIGKQWN
jgi:hypothetical protein